MQNAESGKENKGVCVLTFVMAGCCVTLKKGSASASKKVGCDAQRASRAALVSTPAAAAAAMRALAFVGGTGWQMLCGLRVW
jgi:hypothetical protein